jgi:hypothetical protein
MGTSLSNTLAGTEFPTRDPDHVLQTLLETKAGLQSALIHVYVPRLESEAPFFEIHSDAYQLTLDDSHRWSSFVARGRLTTDETGFIEVTISEFAWTLATARYVSADRWLPRLQGTAFEMRLVRDHHIPTEDQSRTLIYSLSDNPHLEPTAFMTPHIDGRRTRKTAMRYSFRLAPDANLVFDRHFDWSDHGNSSHPRLVAESKGARVFSADKIDADIDDAILLLSLLTAHRTRISQTCEWIGSKESRYFRPRFNWPSEPKNLPFRFGLVQLQYLKLHFTAAWSVWRETKQRKYLRSAIYAVLPGSAIATPLAFQRCYGAPEGLVKGFSPKSGQSGVLQTQSPIATSLRELRKRVSQSEPASVVNHLDAAIARFSEPTFREHFDYFCERWGVQTGDLWPMFANKQGLSFIRNRLIHGATFEESKDVEFALWIATRHLEFILIRVLCAVLRVPLAQTWAAPTTRARDLTMFTKYDVARDTIANI